jgi:mono/diheme cytochrome c family protein
MLFLSGWSLMAQSDIPVMALKGPELYRGYCATCHGMDAQWNGPMADALKLAVPNLTTIAKRNSGKFPSERITKIIDGSEALSKAHGPRTMPVWGPVFSQVEQDRDWGKVRVDNLVRYLQSIQKK